MLFRSFPLPCKEDERTRRQYNTKGNVHIKEIFKIIGLKRRVEVVSMSGETSTEEKVLLHSIVSFHMGRRTHSSIGVHGGIDPMSMSKQLGHSGLEMTSRYVGSDNKKLGGMFDFLGTKKKEEVLSKKLLFDSCRLLCESLQTSRAERSTRVCVTPSSSS